MKKIPYEPTKRERKPRWNWAKHAQRNHDGLIVKDVLYKIKEQTKNPYTHFIIKDWDEFMEVFTIKAITKKNEVRILRVISPSFRSSYLKLSSRVFDKRETLKVALKGLIP
jgi:hypothetical protein